MSITRFSITFWPALLSQRGPRLASGLYPAIDNWCWDHGTDRITFCQSSFEGYRLSMRQKQIEMSETFEIKRQLETGETTPEIELEKLGKFFKEMG